MWMIAGLNLCQQLNQCQWGHRCFELFWLAFRKSGSWYSPWMLRFYAEILSHTLRLGLHLQSIDKFHKRNLLQWECNEGTGESCEPVVSLARNKTNVTLSGNHKCKSIAAMCMADTEVSWIKLWWFCIHTIGLPNKICSLSSLCFNLFFFS